MSQQQQQGGGDNSLDFFWGIGLILVAGLAIWYFGRVYVLSAIYAIRYYEILLIDYVLRGWSYIAGSLGLPLPDTSSLISALNVINEGATPETPFSVLTDMSNSVGWYLAFPVALILVVLAFVAYNANVAGKFKRLHSMKTLRDSESSLWHGIHPVLKHDLVNVDIDEGPWASALTPMQFAKQKKLLIEDRSKPDITVTVNKGSAAKEFSMQIGPYFTKFEAMPPHAQALFAIFAARAGRDRKGSDKLLEQLSMSYASGQIDYSGARALAAKHINTKIVIYALSRHAYILTLMATMLEVGRTDGVMASAEFLWLKPVDRRLWYMLNSVGRQTPFSEVSGPYSHWLVEKKLGRPMRVPMVDEAVRALEVAIADIIYEPDEDDGEIS